MGRDLVIRAGGGADASSTWTNGNSLLTSFEARDLTRVKAGLLQAFSSQQPVCLVNIRFGDHHGDVHLLPCAFDSTKSLCFVIFGGLAGGLGPSPLGPLPGAVMEAGLDAQISWDLTPPGHEANASPQNSPNVSFNFSPASTPPRARSGASQDSDPAAAGSLSYSLSPQRLEASKPTIGTESLEDEDAEDEPIPPRDYKMYSDLEVQAAVQVCEAGSQAGPGLTKAGAKPPLMPAVDAARAMAALSSFQDLSSRSQKSASPLQGIWTILLDFEEDVEPRWHRLCISGLMCLLNDGKRERLQCSNRMVFLGGGALSMEGPDILHRVCFHGERQVYTRGGGGHPLGMPTVPGMSRPSFKTPVQHYRQYARMARKPAPKSSPSPTEHTFSTESLEASSGLILSLQRAASSSSSAGSGSEDEMDRAAKWRPSKCHSA